MRFNLSYLCDTTISQSTLYACYTVFGGERRRRRGEIKNVPVNPALNEQIRELLAVIRRNRLTFAGLVEFSMRKGPAWSHTAWVSTGDSASSRYLMYGIRVNAFYRYEVTRLCAVDVVVVGRRCNVCWSMLQNNIRICAKLRLEHTKMLAKYVWYINRSCNRAHSFTLNNSNKMTISSMIKDTVLQFRCRQALLCDNRAEFWLWKLHTNRYTCSVSVWVHAFTVSDFLNFT